MNFFRTINRNVIVRHTKYFSTNTTHIKPDYRHLYRYAIYLIGCGTYFVITTIDDIEIIHTKLEYMDNYKVYDKVYDKKKIMIENYIIHFIPNILLSFMWPLRLSFEIFYFFSSDKIKK